MVVIVNVLHYVWCELSPVTIEDYMMLVYNFVLGKGFGSPPKIVQHVAWTLCLYHFTWSQITFQASVIVFCN